MKRYRILLAVVAALIAALGTARAISAKARTATVTTSDQPRPLLAPALVESVSDRVELGFELAGRIVEVRVQEGDRVQKGQLLARLDDALARAQVARARAALASASARRDLATSGSLPEEIAAARAEAAAARAQATERDGSRARAVQLSATAAISPAQLDAERGQADAALAQAHAAEARLQRVERGTRVELRREAIAQVAAAEAELNEALTLLARTELRAPEDGVVLRRLLEPGTQVSTVPPTVVLALADVDHLQLRAEVDEANLGGVHASQRGYATADAFGGRRFTGSVVRVARELGRKRVRTDDPRVRVDTRVLEVSFALDDPSGLPLGLRMELHLL